MAKVRAAAEKVGFHNLGTGAGLENAQSRLTIIPVRSSAPLVSLRIPHCASRLLVACPDPISKISWVRSVTKVSYVIILNDMRCYVNATSEADKLVLCFLLYVRFRPEHHAAGLPLDSRHGIMHICLFPWTRRGPDPLRGPNRGSHRSSQRSDAFRLGSNIRS